MTLAIYDALSLLHFELERRARIVNGDRFHDPFQVRHKSVLEDYFEIHSFKWARSWLPEWPRPGVVSA